MKVRHEICATHDLSRKYNEIVNGLDFLITYLLRNVSPADGTPLHTDLQALKAEIVEVGVSLKDIKAALLMFVTKRNITYDLSKYIDINATTLNTKLSVAETLLTKIATDISKVSVNTIDKIKTYASTVTNPTVNVSAVMYENAVKYANIVNDLLDASSYVLHNINPDDGTALGFTDEQKKERVRMYLNQIPLFIGKIVDSTLLTECNEMEAVADYVLIHLDDTALNDLGTYIDANVEKLPLMRRNWA